MAAAVGLALPEGSGLGRGDVAGADAVALDVVLAVLGADVAGEHLQAALRGGVGAHGLAAELGHHRADVDDLALAALHHLGEHGGGDDERGDEVHVDDGLELGALHLVHRDTLDNAGVVHEDVDLAHLFVDLLHEGLHVVLLGHVAHVPVYVRDARFLIIVQAPLQRGLVDVVEDDVPDAGFDKSFGDVEADSVGSARDPGVLAFEGEEVCHIFVWLVFSFRPQR